MWREEGQDDRFLCDPRYTDREREVEKNEKERNAFTEASVPLFACLQERSHSPGLLALQTGREAEPTADSGAGTSHPKGSHLQGKLTHKVFRWLRRL